MTGRIGLSIIKKILGLPDNHIWCITIDSLNIKWIGLGVYYGGPIDVQPGGLVKFDGKNWTNFNTSNSGLPDDNIHAIAIDKQGKKWIGTYNGLAVFDDNHWKVLQ